MDGCLQNFKKYSSFKSHLARKHRNQSESSTDEDVFMYTSIQFDSQSREDDDTSVLDSVSHTMIDTSSTPHVDIQVVDDAGPIDVDWSNVETSTALFLLTLKEQYRATQVCVDFTIEQFQHLIDRIVTDIKVKLTDKLSSGHELDEETLSDIMSVFSHVDPFINLGSQYMQNKYYLEKFGLVVSYHDSAMYIYTNQSWVISSTA